MKEFFKEKILKPTNEMAKLAGLTPINMDNEQALKQCEQDREDEKTDIEDEEDGEAEMTCGSMDRF